MSVINSPYQNSSNNGEGEEDYYNDTMFTAIGNIGLGVGSSVGGSGITVIGNNNLPDINSGNPEKSVTQTSFEVPDLINGEDLGGENELEEESTYLNRNDEREGIGEAEIESIEFGITTPRIASVATTTTKVTAATTTTDVVKPTTTTEVAPLNGTTSTPLGKSIETTSLSSSLLLPSSSSAASSSPSSSASSPASIGPLITSTNVATKITTVTPPEGEDAVKPNIKLSQGNGVDLNAPAHNRGGSTTTTTTTTGATGATNPLAFSTTKPIATTPDIPTTSHSYTAATTTVTTATPSSTINVADPAKLTTTAIPSETISSTITNATVASDTSQIHHQNHHHHHHEHHQSHYHHHQQQQQHHHQQQQHQQQQNQQQPDQLQHKHQQQLHHHLNKTNRKHSNRQHRQRLQSHRRHQTDLGRTPPPDDSASPSDLVLGKEEGLTKSIDFNSLDDITVTTGSLGKYSPPPHRIGVGSSVTYDEDENDAGRRTSIHPKTASTISSTTRDSNIHIVKPERLPEIIPSTPIATNSKIIEIKTSSSRKVKRTATGNGRGSNNNVGDDSGDNEPQVEIEPEYLIDDDPSFNNESEQDRSGTSFNTRTENPAGGASGDAGIGGDVAAVIDKSSASAANDLIDAEATGGDGWTAPVRLDGFAGMLQIFFGIEKPIDVTVFAHPPSAEFVNLLFALLVWSVRYPAVFWTTTKPFATVFSVQMIASALDIIFSYVGVSNLYKLQVYSEAMPVQNSGLILNAVVTIALFLLSTCLLIASSMIMYLYGHGRLAAKMRDRSLITMKSSETWIYFAHCASLCYVLALAVVKAPLLNDLSATYKNNLNCTTFVSALISVVHILLWIVVWLGLTAKRRWTFKLPPIDAYGITKASTQPLLMTNRGGTAGLTGVGGHSGSGGGGSGCGGGTTIEQKSFMSTASSTDGGVDDIYWPKLTPSSPKLKVTFNEIPSTSDDVLLIGDQEQKDGKRNSSRGATVCFTGTTGEIDDGDYATLRSATAATIIGIGVGGAVTVVTTASTATSAAGNGNGVGSNANGSGKTGFAGNGNKCNGGNAKKILHLSEYDELPPPPPPINAQSSISASVVGINIMSSGDYANSSIVDDNTSEEGKLLACVRDDSVTYASTRELEPTPPLPAHAGDSVIPPRPPPVGMAPQAVPEIMQLSSSPEHLVSPLAPVTVTVHTNEAHIASSSTPRCLRRADSGVPNEALSPRSDTESTTSPPERAPSESSSGVHSGEERDVEVVIRPRVTGKPPAKPPQPPIQEEPYGRSTNMKMSSFITDTTTTSYNRGTNSATLPLTRTIPEQKFDYTHCSTMPLPAGCHSYQQQQQLQQLQQQQQQQLLQQQQQQQQQHHHYSEENANAGCDTIVNAGYAEYTEYANSPSAKTTTFQQPNSTFGQYKSQVGNYANSAVVMAVANAAKLQQQQQQPQHTILPNGVRYSTPHFLRRLPHVTLSATESPYGHLGLGAGHHAFSKIIQDPLANSLAGSSIPEDRDSANYSMTSDQDCGLYMTAGNIN